MERGPDNVVRLVAELGRPAWQVWRSPWAVIPFTPPEVVRLYQTLAKVLREIGLGPGAVPSRDEELRDDVRRALLAVPQAVLRAGWKEEESVELARRVADILSAKGWTKQ